MFAKGLLKQPNFLNIASTRRRSALLDETHRTFPTIGLTFFDQNQLPSV